MTRDVANPQDTALRQADSAQPDPFEVDLATSLNDQALGLSDLGRPQEALERFDEAVEIRRRLASANPDAFEADLATSLNNQAAMLSVVGRPRESLTAIEEALHMMVPKLEITPDLLPDGGWRILRAYIRLHQQLQTKPDHALIKRHIAVLKTVEGCSTFGPRQVTAEDSVPQVRQLGLQEEQR